MTRLFTRHDLERAARLALQQRDLFPDADAEVIAPTIVARMVNDADDWLPMDRVRARVREAYARGERAARVQQVEALEIVLHDLLT